MKTKYIKGIMALSITALLFSSCLKDPGHVFNPEITSPNVAQFFNAGLGAFSKDAVTGAGIDTVTFAVGVTLSTPPTTPSTMTLAVDNTLIDAYNTANPGILYLPIPTAAYKLATSVVVPAGKNSATTTIIIDRTQLDPAASYMLPVKLVGVSPNIPIAANLNVHYFHIIGNDFAGTYVWDYYRYNDDHVLPTPSGGTTLGQVGLITPISPTEFQMITGYNGQGVRYDVQFKRTVDAATGAVTYSNWALTFVPDDVTKIWLAAGITITQPAIFQVLDPVSKTFTLQYIAYNGSAYRYIIDSYHK